MPAQRHQPMRNREAPPRHERGAALLFFVFLLSAVLALGTYDYLASTQSIGSENPRLLTNNRAKAAALLGVDAMSTALNQAYCSGTSAPNGPCVGSIQHLDALGTDVTAATSSTLDAVPFTTHAQLLYNNNGNLLVQSTGTYGGSAQVVHAILHLVPDGQGTASDTNLSDAVSLSGDSDFSNQVKLEGGSGSTLSDNGTISTHNSFSGFQNIVSTQSISFANSATTANVYSDGDITITNSGTFGVLDALGNISLQGGVDVSDADANGTFSLSNGTDVSGSVTAIGNVSIDDNNGTVSQLTTDGNVSADNAHIGTAQVQGNYDERSDGSVQSGQAGGTVTAPSYASVHITEDPGLSVPITPLNRFTVNTQRIPATSLEADANVDFLPPPADAAGNVFGTAIVRNENGIPNGTYYLYADRGPNYNTDVWLSASATSPTELYKIIQGYSASSPLSYSEGDWSYRDFANKPSMIPGVMWFDGSLTLTDTGLYDGIIATGTITTANEETNYAPNFAYGEPGDPECDATGFSIHGQTVSPSNLCTTPNYTPASIGNIALLSGDDLDFNNSTVVYGDVIADNLIHASNALTIHGYINSENAKKSGNLNTFSNSVTVDVEKLPASFTASVPSHYSATQPAGGVTEHSVEVTGVRWAP